MKNAVRSPDAECLPRADISLSFPEKTATFSAPGKTHSIPFFAMREADVLSGAGAESLLKRETVFSCLPDQADTASAATQGCL